MNTKKLRKVLIVALALVAVCITSVVGTLAYIKSTDSVSNTFSIGNIEMKLDEAKVKADGTVDGTTRVKANSYKLMPGATYTKDPTVTIGAGSEPCYVRVLVTVKNYAKIETAFGLPTASFKLADIANSINSNWVLAKTTKGSGSITFEYRYNGVVNATSETKLPAVFTSISIPGTVTDLTGLETVEINVVANAIQQSGFANADAAWAAFAA